MLATLDERSLFWSADTFDRFMSRRQQITTCGLMRAGGFEPDDWQVEFAESPDLRKMVVAGRQSGKTTVCSAAILETPLRIPESTTVVASRTLRQTARMLARARRLFRRVELSGLDIGGVTITNRDVTAIRFSNGSEVLALPGTADNVRGETVHRMVVEEGAFVPDELFNAVTPMMATTGGDILAISTAYAELGWFYSEWTDPASGWHKQLVTSWDITRIPREFLEAERRRMPAHVFAREYECVFQAAVGGVFRLDDLAALPADEVVAYA